MRKTSRNLVRWVSAVVLTIAGSVAHANLVKNPGFESGESFWSPVGNATEVDDAAHTGGLGLHFVAKEQPTGSVRQLFTLVSTEDYALKFFLKGSLAALSITFDGLPFDKLFEPRSDPESFDDPVTGDEIFTDWFIYTALIKGSTGGLLLFAHDASSPSGGDLFLDDVSLVCTPGTGTCDDGGGNHVPEPGSLLLVGAALSALAVYRRRKVAV